MKLHKAFAAPIALALALGLAACGQQNQPTTPGGSAPAPSTKPSISSTAQDIKATARDGLKQGGEIRLAINEFAENWNPMNVAGNELDYTHVREPLSSPFFNFDAEGTPTFNKNFLTAEPKVENNPNTKVTYSLNPKAVWGDGTAISVKDFQATWKACDGSNEKFECATTEGYDQIASIEQGATAQDIVVTFKSTYPDWVAVFAGGPARAESVADETVFNTGWSTLVGHEGWFSGPYKLGSYDTTAKIITLVPNDKWWGDKPKLDKVIFRVVPIEAQAQAFANNEIDSFDIGVNADFYARAKAVTDGEVRRAASPQWRHITLNQDASAAMKDKAVRQAILMGLDRMAIATSDMAGMNLDPVVLNNHTFMTNQKQYQDLAALTGIKFDREKAKKTLEDAGYKAGADGMRAKDGKPLEVSFSVLTGVKVSENEGAQFQSQLKEIGIKVNLVQVASKDFSQTLAKRTFESIAFTWVGNQFPYNGLGQWFNPKSSSNFSGYNNDKVTELIGKIATEMDKTKRDQYVLEAEKMIWEDVQIIPLYQRPEQVAVKAKLGNFGAYGLGSRVWENIGWVN
ncbi:MAG TPA: ABC transporter family substrate-binding protein [Propionibacteriaceae bacterium]|nr:ABC transporter family substrate-binding protein [Propionibacteriaceae bacterium]HPZ49568.1 ABC transporter family substrate-binding protein [Propionibacteriaceae bacterium]HQE31138.1 ABC transporter family substrate-binding protein [Propionibacteriaceae bacterium]